MISGGSSGHCWTTHRDDAFDSDLHEAGDEHLIPGHISSQHKSSDQVITSRFGMVLLDEPACAHGGRLGTALGLAKVRQERLWTIGQVDAPIAWRG